MAAAEVLTRRRLNRTLLARQHLLERVDRPVLDEVAHLIGLQAQEPLDPYTALWSRLVDFRPEALGDEVGARRAIRVTTLRNTVHLHTADDAVRVRALTQEVAGRHMTPTNAVGRALAGIDAEALLRDAEVWFTEAPRHGGELKEWLLERHPDRDPDRLISFVRYTVPLAQRAPRGVWGRSARATWSPLAQYAARPLPAVGPDDEADLILRYLAAYGPASPADLASWSGWTRAAARLDRLRDRLVTYRHEETGRELFDVPDGPSADPDEPAPVRFLPEFDDVTLAHADRSRIVPSTVTSAAVPRIAARPRMMLVDGSVGGLWSASRDDDRARLRLVPLRRWTRAERRDAAEEGARLLGLLHPDADPDVVVDQEAELTR